MDDACCDSYKASNGSSEAQRDTFLFDIERWGDPRIDWMMYYDFVVSKTGAYYQLQPEYLPTLKFPARVEAEIVTIGNKNLHHCCVLGCTAEPFTRNYDLERHFNMIHGNRDYILCDYDTCRPNILFGKDQCREHYREYHAEDLMVPKISDTISAYPATIHRSLDPNWWRCSKCFQRVQVKDDGYVCPYCNVACEPERVSKRRKLCPPQHSGCDTNNYAKANLEENALELSRVLRQHNRLPAEKGSKYTLSVRKASRSFPTHAPKTVHFLITLSFLAGVLKGVLYMWMSQRMKLGIPSEFMRKTMATVVKTVPLKILEASYLVSTNLIIISCLAASAVWAFSTVGWIMANSQKSRLVYWYMYLLLTALFWMLFGVTPEELLLVFLPVSISTGGLLHALYWGIRKKDPTRSLCDTSVPVMVVQKHNLPSPAMEDLEMDLKA